MQFWSPDILGRIASLVGKPCYLDKMIASRERLSYARVLVELSSGDKVIESVKLKGPDGVIYDQRIVFEVNPH